MNSMKILKYIHYLKEMGILKIIYQDKYRLLDILGGSFVISKQIN